MIDNIDKATKELAKTLTEFRDKNDASHDELVQVVNYALDEVKFPANTTGNLTAKGEAELAAKKAKETKVPDKKATPVPSASTK